MSLHRLSEVGPKKKSQQLRKKTNALHQGQMNNDIRNVFIKFYLNKFNNHKNITLNIKKSVTTRSIIRNGNYK